MLYQGKSIWDTRQDFGKNRGQSVAFSNGVRDKNTLPCQGTQAKFCEKYEKIRVALKSSKNIRDCAKAKNDAVPYRK